MAFGPDGNLYVSSFYTDQILRYNSKTGEFIDVFAQGNGQPGGLNGPNGLLFVNNSLFVTTQGSVATKNPETGEITLNYTQPSQVLRYDSLTPGSTPTVFATPEPSADSFGFVSLLGLAVGKDDDLYVSDFANGILRYDLKTANLIETFSTNYTTETPPSNNFMGSLAFAPNGDLFTVGFDVSTTAGAVIKYDNEGGSPVTEFEVLVPTNPILERPIGITFFPIERNLVIGTPEADKLIAGQNIEGVADDIFTGSGKDEVDLVSKNYANNNRVFLGSDDDIIYVNDKDRVFGGLGDDIFDATDGKGGSRMSGGSGDDTFYLGSNDRALGGDGDDKFIVQSGRGNLISGGAGADEFQIVTLELPDAANTILDFQMGTDTISILGASKIGIYAENLILNHTNGNTEIIFANQILAVVHGVIGLEVDIITLN
jgi:hypothetical protein